MEDRNVYMLRHKLVDIFKDALMFHRKMTTFQKLVVLTFLVGGFLCIFRTLWFLCVALTYSACLYGAIRCSRYLTHRKTRLGSDSLLNALDILDAFVDRGKNVTHPDSTALEPTYTCSNKCSDIHKHANERNCNEANTLEDIGECFYDANVDVSEADSSVSQSILYCPLDGPNTMDETHKDATICGSQNETDMNKKLETVNKTNEHEISNETYNIVTQAFYDLSKLILRDFIKSWYDLISDDRESLNEADHILQIIVDHIQERLSNVNVLQTTQNILLMFRFHVRALKQAKTTIMLQSKRRRSTVNPANKEESTSHILFKSVEECYGSKVDFHIALKSKEMEKSYLNAIVEVLLIHLLPEELHKSESVVCALREIITTNVLYNVLNLLSDPTFIHEKVVQITSYESPGTSNENESTMTMSPRQEINECGKYLKPILVKEKVNHDPKSCAPLTPSPPNRVNSATDYNETTLSVGDNASDIELSWKNDTELHPISMGMCNECNRLCSDDKDRISPRLHTCSLGTTPRFFDSSNAPSTHENIPKHLHEGTPPIVFSIGDATFERSVSNDVFDDIPMEMSGDNEDSITECPTPREMHEESVQKTEVKLISQNLDQQEAMGDTGSVHSECLPQDDSHLAVPCKPKCAEEKSKLHVFSNISVPSIPNFSVPSIPNINVPSIPNNFFNFQLPQLPFRKPSASVSESNRSASDLSAIGGADDTEAKNIRKSKSSAELSLSQENAALAPFDGVLYPTECPATFQDAFITATETAKEAGSGSQYTLYSIQYEALYHSEDDQLVHRTGVVKRRFREFVNLQSRLEDNSAYKKSMRDVKGPKRLVSLPFFNMDKESIDNRKKLLESFLSALIKKDDICNGEELKQFLAYSGDGHIAFVRKIAESTGPRIDQRFVKKMSGVFDKIVEVLPSLPQELPRIITKSEVKDEDISGVVTMDTDNIDVHFDFQDDKNVCRHVQDGLDRFIDETSASLLQTMEDESFSNTTLGHSMLEWQEQLLGTTTRMAGDGSDVPDLHIETGPDPSTPLGVDEAPLSSALLDVLAVLLQGHDSWVCRHHVMHTGNIVIGKALHRYLETKIGYLTSQVMGSFYLHTLRDTLWPDGQLSIAPRSVLTDLQKEVLKDQASRCLANILPGVLKTLLGEEDFSLLMKEIMDSVKYEKINRHFWYTLFDVLIEMIFPEVTTEELHRKLSTVSF